MRRSWSMTASTTTAVIPSPSWISSMIPVHAASPTTFISRPIPSSFMTMDMGAIPACARDVPECITSSGRSWMMSMRLGVGRWSVLLWRCDRRWYVVVSNWARAELRTLLGWTSSRRKRNTWVIYQFICL